jgi:hypothetical protein
VKRLAVALLSLIALLAAPLAAGAEAVPLSPTGRIAPPQSIERG